jgi:hypothetical protein
MKIQRITQTWSAAFVLAMASTGFAVDPETPAAEQSEVKDLIRAEKVAGSALWDFHGNQIGTIDYVLLQPSGGMVFAVINADKFVEADHKVAVPWSKIYVKRKSDASGGVVLTLDTTKEFLKGAPEFDEEGDDLADPAKAGSIYRYWRADLPNVDRAIDRLRERRSERETGREDDPES